MSRESIRARLNHKGDDDWATEYSISGDEVDLVEHVRDDMTALLAVADAAEAFLDGYEEQLPVTQTTPSPLYAVRERLRAALDALEALP